MHVFKQVRVRKSPAEESSNSRLSDWLSKKYCLASDLKSIVGSTCLYLGKRKGEGIEMEDGPLIKESGSHKTPGLPTKSTRYSLYGQELHVSSSTPS